MNLFASSTQAVPGVTEMPRHVAIIMDGNGRWAQKRSLPRVAGHRRGVEAVRRAVEFCIGKGISYLTLFAFSSENWRRPADEVAFLMKLFITALEREVDALDRNGVRLRVVGDLSPFDSALQAMIDKAQARTARHHKLTLTIAANYGGRWDILQAASAAMQAKLARGQQADLTEAEFAEHLAMAYAPEPDLFIRTGGEQRISNFLLWQLAYSELYFTDAYWPDFGDDQFMTAIASYQQRERRFGRTSDQVQAGASAQVR